MGRVKNKHYKRNGKHFNKFIFLICLIIMIYSGYKILVWVMENKNSQEIKENIIATVIKDGNESNEQLDQKKIDFNELEKMNGETVGWIKVNNTQIEYPIVKSSDNDFYLTRGFNKELNSSGWIFADFRNKFDGTDKNIIIYGHNRRDGSMFGTLKNVLTKQWCENEENQTITMNTHNGKVEYKVFSVYKILSESYYITTDFNEKSYLKYIEDMKNRSIYNFNVDLKGNSSVLTLSSCDNNNKYRVVLHAIKTEE